WTAEHEAAMNLLKEELTKPPVTALPDVTKPFIVRTDASGTGMGAVLLQEIDGHRAMASPRHRMALRLQEFQPFHIPLYTFREKRITRSEERRVGKKNRDLRVTYHYNKRAREDKTHVVL